MLNRGRNDMERAWIFCPQRSIYGEAITFGTATGKQHLSRCGPDTCCDLLTGLLKPLFGAAAGAVQAGRIAKVGVQIGQHRFKYVRPQWSGRIVVQIDVLHLLNLGLFGFPAVRALKFDKPAFTKIFFVDAAWLFPNAD